MLNSKALASAIMATDMSSCTDTTSALSKLWTTVCTYVSTNSQVQYAWAGTNPEGVVDPIVIVNCKIIATPSPLVVSKLTDANSAMKAMSLSMNTAAALWTVIPNSITSPGFLLTPAFIIPKIQLSVSNATERFKAIYQLSDDIISGITKAATPVMTGTHGGVYLGAATFAKIS